MVGLILVVVISFMSSSLWSVGGGNVGRHQVKLEVHRCNFGVKTKQGMRTIVDDLSLSVESGEVLAIMGPSGAGKTTFLELMTLQLPGARATGTVTLNGKPLTINAFHEHCCLAEQYDSHWAFLTCQEIMQFTAELTVKEPRARQERTHLIMEHLGLLECANTRKCFYRIELCIKRCSLRAFARFPLSPPSVLAGC